MSAADQRPITPYEAAALFAPLSGHRGLILAVSGGPDSTALLWLVARWCKAQHDPPAVRAITVDHGLRRESHGEAAAVARQARSLGVPHRTLKWTGRKPATGLQEAARQARYRLLAEAARKAGADAVVTAHTLDDQAETVLFRLARGSGVTGLAGMAPGARMPSSNADGIALARPLLGIPKLRLIATLKAAGIPYAFDSSNTDPRFARPRLRAIAASLAREGLTADRLALLARRVQRVEAALHEVLDDALLRLAPGPWPAAGPIMIDADAFATLPDEIGLRLLGRLVDRVGEEGPVELGKLETLSEALLDAIEGSWVQAGSARRFRRTLAGASVTLSRGQIAVERAPARRGRASKRR